MARSACCRYCHVDTAGIVGRLLLPRYDELMPRCFYATPRMLAMLLRYVYEAP